MDPRRMLLDKLKNSDSMKKVTIMSPNTEGLKEGVSKVQELLQKRKDLLDLGKKLPESNLPDDPEEMMENSDEENIEEHSPELSSLMDKIESLSESDLLKLKEFIDKSLNK